MLRGLMMDRPLLVSSAIDYAAEVYPDVEIVSQTVEGGLHRYGYRAARERVGRLANALKGLGIKPGDRVATLAWNGYRHFELYYAIAGIGAVCHTINPRLFDEQITYIANHAEDTALFFDLTFLPLVEKLKPALKTIGTYVLLTDRAHMPAATAAQRPALLRGAAGGDGLANRMARASTRTRPARCATPRAPPASPRACSTPTARWCCTACTLATTRHDLFAHNRTHPARGAAVPRQRLGPALHHAADRLHPRSCPAPSSTAPRLYDLMESERVEAGWGVPTVWLGLLDEIQEARPQAGNLTQILSGGSAMPQAHDRYAVTRDYDIEVMHGWGMTEMSPVGTLTVLRPEERSNAAAGARRAGRQAGPAHVRRRPQDHRREGQPRAAPTARLPASCSCAAPTIVSGYFKNAGGLRQADRRRGLVCHRRRRQDHARTAGC